MIEFSRIVAFVVVTGFAMGIFIATDQVQGEEEGTKAKHTIKDVMKAHKGGKDSLLGKVKSGNVSDAEKQELVDLYISLYENDPPVGEQGSWKQKSGSALMAAVKVMVGRDGAVEQLTAATNCAACHKVHKPK